MQCYSMPKRPIRCHNYDVTAVCLAYFSLGDVGARLKNFLFLAGICFKGIAILKVVDTQVGTPKTDLMEVHIPINMLVYAVCSIHDTAYLSS